MAIYTPRYFAPRYWPGRYWSHAQSATNFDSAYIRRAVGAFLAADAGVASVVGASVFYACVPQPTALPALTFQLVSVDRPRRLDGPGKISAARFQLASVARDVAVNEELAELVRQAMDGFRGNFPVGPVRVMETVLEDERDLWEQPGDGTDRRIYRTVLDYLIRYREPRPVRLTP